MLQNLLRGLAFQNILANFLEVWWYVCSLLVNSPSFDELEKCAPDNCYNTVIPSIIKHDIQVLRTPLHLLCHGWNSTLP